MPLLIVEVDAIRQNSSAVAAMLARRDIALVGVTKGCLGDPDVAAAMLAGGAIAIADSRDHALRRLRAALPGAELHRISLPSVAGPFEPGDLTYISSIETARAVAARAAGFPASTRRKVMVAVETGDEREGVPADRLEWLVDHVEADGRLEFSGISTNYACFRGTGDGIRQSVEMLAQAVRELRAAGHNVARVSGGNSSLLALLAEGEGLLPEVTELRCGEALLMGRDALFYGPLPGCRRACTLRAEVLEEYTKPAREGVRHRLVLGIGRQDLGNGRVTFIQPGLREIGRSADYVVVDSGHDDLGRKVGDMVELVPAYDALEAAWGSPYVELRLR